MSEAIENDEQHKKVLSEIKGLMAEDPSPDTENGKRLEMLAVLAEAYEKARFPIRESRSDNLSLLLKSINAAFKTLQDCEHERLSRSAIAPFADPLRSKYIASVKAMYEANELLQSYMDKMNDPD